jgi:hypothetical protein
MAARSIRTAVEVPLSKQRVVTESIRLADSEGVDKLSMRRLADELGAGDVAVLLRGRKVTSVRRRDRRRVDGSAAVRLRGWKAAVVRCPPAVLGRHPWAITLMESPTTAGPANLRHHEAVLACLREAGFSVEMATHVYWLLDSYVYGFALQEASLPFDTAKEFADMGEDVYMPQLPPDQYPYLNEAAATLLAAGYDPADEFTFGLDLILGALEALTAAP